MLLWTNHITEQHYSILDKIKETGFDGIEAPMGKGNTSYYRDLGNHLSSMGLEVTVVTSLNPQQNIASAERSIRQAGLERLKWAIDMSHHIGAQIICGPLHSAFACFSRQPPTTDELKWSADMLRAAGEYAATAQITLAVEALNRFECYLCNTMEGLQTLVQQVNHPHVRAMYDTYHTHQEEKNQRTAILTIKDHLHHVHISENDRGTPGKGQVHWAEVFDGLKETGYRGWLTIEAFSTVVPEFASSINVWRNYSPAEEVYEQGYRFIKDQWEKIHT